MSHTQKKTRLIYLFPYTLTPWDAERYGFKSLLAKGIDLTVFDVSALISTRSGVTVDPMHESYITKITSYAMLEQEIKKTTHQAAYIDCINGLNGLQWKGRKIFKLFKTYDVDYYLVEIGSLPLLPQGQRRHFKSKLKKALNLRKLFTYLCWKGGRWLAHQQHTYLNCYQLPKKIFVGHTEMVEQYLQKYRLERNRVFPIHSFDYDRYLNYKRQPSPAVITDNKLCVFLDQALAHHSDFGKSVSFSPVTAEKYLPSLNQFFDKLEQETGLTVVIAASPRSRQQDMAGAFGNRAVIRDDTLSLVAQSELVLMHSSTAVSFAVLFDKPILLLKTTEMLNAHGFGHFLDNMALSLGVPTLCIDHKEAVDKVALQDYARWERNYDNYKYKYIKTKGLADKTTWDVVAEEFCRSEA